MIRLVGLFAVWLFFLDVGHAFGLSLWPFYVRKELENGSVQVRILPPFGLYERTKDAVRYGILPFFLKERSLKKDEKTLYALYPLLQVRSSERETSISSLLVLSYVHKREPDVEKRFRIFPLYFYERDQTYGTRWMFFPFWGTVNRFMGHDEIFVRFFPAYLRVTNRGVSKTFRPFPFFASLSGEGAKGWDLFPFYGSEEDPGKRTESFVLWPFHVRRTDIREDGPWISKVNFPVWAHLSNPQFETQMYGLYNKTVSKADNYESKGFPWPFMVNSHDTKTGARRTLRLFPFFQRQEYDNYKAEFLLWPLWRFHGVSKGEHLYLRDDSVFFLYRNERKISLDNQRREVEFHGLMPLVHVRDASFGRKIRVFSLLEQVFPYNEGIEKTWAPLWGVFERNEWGISVLYDFIHFGGR
jgi:hypothetical protein